MKIGELSLRCAFDAIDQPRQRINTEHEPQHPNSGEESDILPHTLPPKAGVPSGFEVIDCVTSGWQPSDLILVVARNRGTAKEADRLRNRRMKST